MSIYLAGPIDNVEQEEARGWRESLAGHVGSGVLLVSPAHAFLNASLATAASVVWINRHLIDASDGLLADLSGQWGFGTIREIEFAALQRKPIAVAAGDNLSLYQSLAAHDLTVVQDLENAADTLVSQIHNRKEQAERHAFPKIMGFVVPEDDEDDRD